MVIRVPVSGSARPALVDHWNARLVRPFSWSLTAEGYAHARLSGSDDVYLHQLIVCPPDGLTVDHIDRDPLNCTEANMRLATKREQLWNQGLRCDSTSGLKGVSYITSGQRRKRWVAQIKLPHRRLLTYHLTPEEAAEQYDTWALQYFGPFACTNEMLGLL